MKTDRRWWNDGRAERECAKESEQMLTVHQRTMVVDSRNGTVRFEAFETVLRPIISDRVDWGQ